MALGGAMGPAWAQHGTPDAPCGGLARISKQLPLDAGATALAGRRLGEWSPGAPGTLVMAMGLECPLRIN